MSDPREPLSPPQVYHLIQRRWRTHPTAPWGPWSITYPTDSLTLYADARTALAASRFRSDVLELRVVTATITINRFTEDPKP